MKVFIYSFMGLLPRQVIMDHVCKLLSSIVEAFLYRYLKSSCAKQALATVAGDITLYRHAAFIEISCSLEFQSISGSAVVVGTDDLSIRLIHFIA